MAARESTRRVRELWRFRDAVVRHRFMGKVIELYEMIVVRCVIAASYDWFFLRV